MTFPKTKICIFVSMVFYASSGHSQGLEETLNNVFDGMVNGTPPGIYNTQRRGVMSGGRLLAKTQIGSIRLIDVSPPSLSGGCGGIDMYGGSMSFISKDEIVTFLRQVAANSAGYLFHLGLENVSPSIAAGIQTFQKKVQALNSMFKNSCSFAQGAVNDLLSSVENKRKTTDSLSSMFSHAKDDFFDASETTSTPQKDMQVHGTPEAIAKMEETTGNLLFKALKQSNTMSWFHHGDQRTLEVLMSITGSIIIKTLGTAPDDTQNKVTVLPAIVNINTLIDGSPTVKVYKCESNSKCEEPAEGSVHTVSLKGMKDRINELMIGTPSNPGVIDRYASSSLSLTTEQQRLAAALPLSINSMLKRLSQTSPEATKSYMKVISMSVANTLAIQLIRDYTNAARAAMTVSDSGYSKQFAEQLYKTRLDNETLSRANVAQYGSLVDTVDGIRSLLSVSTETKLYVNSRE